MDANNRGTHGSSGGDVVAASHGSTSAATAAAPNTKPRTNFPLPAELRDVIFGFLLDGDLVSQTLPKRQPEDTGADEHDPYAAYQRCEHKYAFSTSIFYVNKTIGTEALDFFYTRNAFVLIHFNMPGFILMRNLVDMPLVRPGNLNFESARSKASLVINLFWQDAPFHQPVEDLGYAQDSHGTMIIRMAELPKLFKILRFLCAYTFPPSLLVMSERHNLLHLQPAAPRGRLDMRAGNVPPMYKPLSNAQQGHVLAGLGTLLGGGISLEIAGLEYSEPIARGLRARMTQSLIWPAAFISDHLNVCRSLLRDIVEVANAGDLDCATVRLRALQVLEKQASTSIRDAVAGCGFDDLRLDHFAFDLFCTLITFLLRQDKPRDAFRLLDDCTETCAPFMLQGFDCGAHFAAHLAVLIFFTDERWVDGLPKVEGLLRRLEDLPKKDAYIAHDLAELRKLRATVEETGDTTLANGFAHRLSVHAMALRPYDSFEARGGRLQHGEDFVGWRDTVHFASLSAQQQTFIQDIQRTENLPVTEFDDCASPFSAPSWVEVGGWRRFGRL